MNISKLKDWELCMVGVCPGDTNENICRRKRIVENFEIEKRVKRHIEETFIDCLHSESAVYIKNNDCINICNALSTAQQLCKNIMLNGPVAKHKRRRYATILNSKKMGRALSVSPAFIKGTLFSGASSGSPGEKYSEMIQNGWISPDHFKKTIGNFYGFIWATFKKEIDSSLKKSESPDVIRDRLGLDFISSYGKGEFLFCLTYIRKKLRKKPIIPTMIEGADSPPFRPTDKSSETGLTADLRDGEVGLPEVVHSAITRPNNVISELDVIGKLEQDPSQNYLEPYV